jgi:DNA-binding XRE family transcriptional regulator
MTAALEQVGRRTVARPDRIGQQTAVEQARAVAEVAAAVQVAQQFPRDLDRVYAEMREACDDIDLAREAFYKVDNRGDGPSVHLARELARIFGNFQYGVHELHRDDDLGQSEVQSFAWDVQTNTRNTRLFISPHQTMKKINGVQTRVEIVDLTAVYLNNQNTGARAVRETILSTLPKKLVREAERICRARLEAGDPEQSASDRTKEALAFFADLRPTPVSEAQLVAHLKGRKPKDWTPRDIADLEVIAGSLRRGETTVADQFPEPQRVTTDEITGGGAEGAPGTAPSPARGPKANQGQMKRIHGLLKDLNVTSDEGIRQAIGVILGLDGPITSRRDLLQDQADVVIAHLEKNGPPPPSDDDAPPSDDEPDGGGS